MSDLSQILPVLKFGGAFVAMVYGIYATVTDFKEDRGGKKVLSRKGYFGIGLLVFSSILAFCSDAAKDYLDQKEADAAKKDLTKHYEDIIADLKQMSGNVARAANPIKDLAFSFVYHVPRDTRLDDYRKRLDAERSNIAQGRFPKGVFWSYQGIEVRISRDSPLFPQSSEIAYELVTSPLTLEFCRAPWTSGAPPRPDMSCDLTRRGEYNDGRSELWWNLKTGALRVATFKISKYAVSSNGKIAAIPDLAGSKLAVFFEAMHLAADGPERIAAVNDLRKRVLFEYLSLEMAGGRSIRINGRDMRKSDDLSHIEYTFPSSLE